jgi:hypothetical protein
MRWKAHFFLNENKPTKSENKFGLPSINYAMPTSEMKAFEEDLVKFTSNITFRKVNDSFLNKIHEDLKKVHSSKTFLFTLINQPIFMKPLLIITTNYLWKTSQKRTNSETKM